MYQGLGMKLEHVKKDRWWVAPWSYERKLSIQSFSSTGEKDLESEDVETSYIAFWASDCTRLNLRAHMYSVLIDLEEDLQLQSESWHVVAAVLDEQEEVGNSFVAP